MRFPISYRNRLRLKKLGKWLIIALVAVCAFLILFLMFVQRYVVYTKDGATIDFHRSAAHLSASTAPEAVTSAPMDVSIAYESPSPSSEDGSPIKGYYLSTQDLQDPEDCLQRAEALEYGATVLLELKNASGDFYYRSKIENAEYADVDLDEIENLISTLRQQGCTLIALIPAFADSSFALENTDSALATKDGALWANNSDSYWLDPASVMVLNRLENIIQELADLGFNEIVLENFYFPSNDTIVYSSQQTTSQLIENAVERLCKRFANSKFLLSFLTDGTDFPARDVSGRLFLENIDATQVDKVIAAYQSDSWDAASRLVFLTNSKDNRFSDRNSLSPMP